MLEIENGKIAILMATYNGEKYIRQQVESIMNQTEQDFLLVIHDDGSTDGTVEVIEELAAIYGASRLQILEGPSTGSAKMNFLWMLSQVQASYYMFADQDDVWKMDKIAKSKERFWQISCGIGSTREYEFNYNLVFTDMEVVDENLRQMYPSFIASIDRNIDHVLPGQLIIDNMAAGCTMFFARDLRDVIVDNLENVDMSKVEMHDRLIITVAAVLGTVSGINEPLSLYRQHGNNEMGAVHETTFDKVIRNVRGRLTGEIQEGHERFIRDAEDFAGEVYKICFKVVKSEKTDRSIFEMSWLKKYSKLEESNLSHRAKVDFYRTNHLERATAKATERMYRWI